MILPVEGLSIIGGGWLRSILNGSGCNLASRRIADLSGSFLYFFAANMCFTPGHGHEVVADGFGDGLLGDAGFCEVVPENGAKR